MADILTYILELAAVTTATILAERYINDKAAVIVLLSSLTLLAIIHRNKLRHWFAEHLLVAVSICVIVVAGIGLGIGLLLTIPARSQEAIEHSIPSGRTSAPSPSVPIVKTPKPTKPISPGPKAKIEQHGAASGAVGGSITTGPCSNVQVGGSQNQASTDCAPPAPKVSVTSVVPSQVADDYQLRVTLKTDRELSGLSFKLAFNSTIENGDVSMSNSGLIEEVTDIKTEQGSLYPNNVFTFSISNPTTLPENGELYITVHAKQPFKLTKWHKN